MEAHTLTVDLGDRSYPIVIGPGLLDGGHDLSKYLAGNRCLVVTNTTVGPLYLDKLKPCLGDATVDVIELPDGEKHKTVAVVETILDKLVDTKAARDVTTWSVSTCSPKRRFARSLPMCRTPRASRGTG